MTTCGDCCLQVAAVHFYLARQVALCQWGIDRSPNEDLQHVARKLSGISAFVFTLATVTVIVVRVGNTLGSSTSDVQCVPRVASDPAHAP